MNLQIIFKPGSKVQKIVKNSDETLTVYCHARAHDGEANTAVIKLVADYLDIPKSKIKIIRGQKSPHKLLKIN